MLDLRHPTVALLLRWFAQCYDVETDPTWGQPRWRRVALPRAGGIGDQDAWLMNALEFVASVQQQVLEETMRRQAVAARTKP